MRAQISKKNENYISKNRYYELKHFCLQYPEWKRSYPRLDTDEKLEVLNKIELLETISKELDLYLGKYILKGVTEGLNYETINARSIIPCGRSMYYQLYRRFFKMLDEVRK